MRPWRLLAGLAVMVALGAYARWATPYPTVDTLLDHPARFDGRRIALGCEAYIQARTPSGFLLGAPGRSLDVTAAGDDYRVGSRVVLRGVFHAPNQVRAEAVSQDESLGVRVALSMLPLIVLVVWAPFAVRVDWARRCLVLRGTGEGVRA